MVYFLFGFYSLLGQTLLLREVAQVFGAHELSLAGALAAWLLWTAAGVFTAARAPKEEERDAARFRSACLLLAAVLPANLLAARLAPGWLPAGEQPGLFLMLAGPAVLTLPAGLAAGLASGLALRRRPAAFYASEAAGAAAAGAFTVAYYFLFPGTGALTLLAPAALLLIAACLHGRPVLRGAAAAGLAAAGLVLALTALQSRAWRLKPPAARPTLPVAQFQGSRLALTGPAGAQTWYEDGRLLYSPEDTAPEELVHLPLLSLPRRPRILLAGERAFFLLPEILKHKPSAVMIAEPDSFRGRFFAARLRPDGVTTISPADSRTASADTFDALIQTCAAPETAAANRYFTAEYFLAARARLRPGGLLVFQLPFSANYLPPQTAYSDASVLAAAKEAFASLTLIPGDRLTVLAADKTPDLNPERLAAAYVQRRLNNKLVVPSALPFMLEPYRRAWAESSLAKAGAVPANRDFEPAAYYRFWRAWLAMVAEPKALLGLAALALGALCAGLMLAGRLDFSAARRTGEAFLMGAWSLGLETALLLAYQAKTGRLNPELGGLFAAFMAAAATGAALAAQLGLRRTWPLELGAAGLAAGAALGAAGLASGAAVWSLIAATGFLSGAFFNAAAGTDGGEIYGWDSLGAAAGGFAAAGFAVPLLGVRGALLCAAAAALAAACGAAAAYFSRTASTVKE